jgi:hypothetical protein
MKFPSKLVFKVTIFALITVFAHAEEKRIDACLPRYVDRCAHGLSGYLTHLLTVLILAQDSNPVGFWLQSKESELASSSELLRLVFYAYPL